MLDHFAPALADLPALDSGPEAQGGAAGAQRSKLQSFIRLTEALSADDADADASASASSGGGAAGGAQHAAGDTFKALVLERGIPSSLASYLVAQFALPYAPSGAAVSAPAPSAPVNIGGPAASISAGGTLTAPAPAAAAAATAAAGELRLCQHNSAQWEAAQGCVGVPLCLQTLGALVRGHGPTARDVAATPGLLPLLHALEGKPLVASMFPHQCNRCPPANSPLGSQYSMMLVFFFKFGIPFLLVVRPPFISGLEVGCLRCLHSSLHCRRARWRDARPAVRGAARRHVRRRRRRRRRPGGGAARSHQGGRQRAGCAQTRRHAGVHGHATGARFCTFYRALRPLAVLGPDLYNVVEAAVCLPWDLT